MTTKIDTVDYSILTLVENEDQPLWKNKLYERFHDNLDELPVADGVSVQTIGRRVDRLSEDGYLENVITSPEELKRDLIIAFKPTEKGREAVEQKRKNILQELVRDTMFTDDKETDFGKEALLNLIKTEFGQDEQPFMEASRDEDEIVSLLTLHYAREEAVQASDGSLEPTAEIMTEDRSESELAQH